MIEAFNSGIEWINHAGAIHWRFASGMFLQTAVLVAVLVVFEFCLRRRVRSVVRYWIWSLVLVKLLLPITLHTPASIAYWLIREPAVVANVSPVPTADEAASLPSSSFDLASDLHSTSNEIPKVALDSAAPPQRRDASAKSSTNLSTVAVAAPPKLATFDASGWLLIAWFTIASLLAVIVIRRAVKVWRLVRRATAASPNLDKPLHVACEVLDLSIHRVRLRISEDVGCPAICGFWRPTILIPPRLINQLDEEQFQLVFAHELFHWKRWDLQINLFQTVLQVIYFYNPAVWIANAVLRRLREEAVDDAVLIAIAAPPERYSNTLLDVAAHSLRPVEINVRLIGILESRKALVSRIHRLATGPLPKSARLGLWGFAAVTVLGLALLPMAGSRRAVADKPAGDTSAKTVPENQEKAAAPIAALSGRIIDENGKPVSDATVRLINSSTRSAQETATTRDGHYVLDRLWFRGEHRLLIYSDRCLGFTDSVDAPLVVLDPEKPIVRDFTLKLACQVRIQTLDEQGHPVQGVQLFKAGSSNPYQANTDRQGWMTIGGLVPAEYVFAFKSDGYVISRLMVKIEAPKMVVERKVVLKRGIDIKGTAVCSDGKPAAGWRVTALPSWWDFNSYPIGELIKKDGTLVLPHIGSGAYDVTISIPRGSNSSESSKLLNNAELIKQKEPLTLHVDAPSPGSMVMIHGHFRFIGGRPKQVIWIHAISSDGQHSSGNWIAGQRSDDFSLGPVPNGKYRLIFDSPETETKQIDSVTAPISGLNVDIQVRGAIVLRGVVDVRGAKSAEPVRDFLIRVVKLKNLRGTNFTPSEKWQRVYNSRGEFAEQVPGPGIYAIEATADGFATIRNEPINTDQLPKTGIHLTLSKGALLTGTVVDEAGRAIDGAVVISSAKAGGHLPMSSDKIPDGTGVRTINGRFQFDGLTPGKDSFHILHLDYALAVAQNVEIRAQGQEPLAIVMKRGGTVSGHVHDEQGRLLAGVSLHFQRYPSGFVDDPEGGRFATAVTDANGYYEIRHLPEESIHILREGRARSPGVYHQTVLPVNAQTRTVDFGGSSTVSGRLFVNGAPLANTKLMLGDENDHNGDFGATTSTDSDGSFVFSGIPAGRRYLYYSVRRRSGRIEEWNRVRALDIHSAARNFGRIDHRVGKVTVNVVGTPSQPTNDAWVYLHYYDPSPFRVQIAAQSRIPRAKGVYIFDDVSPGKYDIEGSAEGKPTVKQMLEISENNLNPTVTLEWPRGTASIRGKIESSLRQLVGNGWIELYSPDIRWSARVRLKEDGSFEITGIPAGVYSLAMMRFQPSTIVPVLLSEINLRDGETKTLNVNQEGVLRSELSKQVLKVTALTYQGITLPGADIRLAGAKGVLKPIMSRAGHVWFFGEPGLYQLTVTFLGADTVRQTVELKPIADTGRWSAQDHELNVTLAPLD